MLDVKNLEFGYKEPLLKGVNLQVQAGESVFILGPSGCGKSTLLRAIAGLEHAEGQVRVQGRDVSALPTHQRHVGMLFQEPALFPHMNVAKNVAFGLRYRGVPKPDWEQEALEWLDVVNLRHVASNHVDDLSGGERQRVALARTLAAKPSVVLLDEPFSALDRPLRDALGPRVKQWLQEQKVASVWVTHDEQEATELGDHVWRLQNGRLQ